MRLGVLVSGRGSNLLSLLKAIRSGALGATVEVVISDVPGVQALERARAFGLTTAVVERSSWPSRKAFEEAIAAHLEAHGVEWVILAGFMRILGPFLLDRYPGRIVNIHPSLLPSFRGLRAQEQAIENSVALAGCTVHEAVAAVDAGPILSQAALAVEPGESTGSLSRRILALEHRLLPATLEEIRRGEGKSCRSRGGQGALFSLSLEGPALVSACLLGIPVRYDGGHCYHARSAARARQLGFLPICPEVLGGLSTPRSPTSFRGGDGEALLQGEAFLRDEEGVNRTGAFLRGAWRALALGRAQRATHAILKEGSPSCGLHRVWVEGSLRKGKGVTAAVLELMGLVVVSEEELAGP